MITIIEFFCILVAVAAAVYAAATWPVLVTVAFWMIVLIIGLLVWRKVRDA